ncbi:beta-lactamase family protein [Ulvibacter sp. MAR_2010_11]|uniref:serine hydrolase n=1 Tax=Ulvibacter sp. MAR_2010_11 TaxID=1250229 RepID=UPI000C2CD8D7|nr:serine hydrolase [Ulvibacter sp. MAR_2010_11]PKA83737.1 beta-lactamase family protein [Ulvibacter sp. MAR_2010_11]
MKKIVALLCILQFLACDTEPTSPLDIALKSKHPAIKEVMEDPNGYEVQILYTQIDKDSTGAVTFTDYSFQLDAGNYFYPASSVKLPVAVLAVEKLIHNFDSLTLDSPYRIGNDSALHTVGDDILKIFTVSDNEAYNRLYEYLGRDYCNKRLRRLGLSPVRITHRLDVDSAANQKRKTLFFPKKDTLPVAYNSDKDGSIEKTILKGTQKGKSFMRNDSLIKKPMDFSQKNYFPLKTQHDLLKRIFFEDNFSKEEQFGLTPSAKETLTTAMRTLPREAGYNQKEFYDSYGKFFIFGDSKDPIPDHIKIYNKVGYAYGTLTDTAYIVDEKEGVQFLLSATILVNKNGIFNDEVYEYETIGIPFLAQLGREIYNYELRRKK